jgi:TolA-binding protein
MKRLMKTHTKLKRMKMCKFFLNVALYSALAAVLMSGSGADVNAARMENMQSQMLLGAPFSKWVDVQDRRGAHEEFTGDRHERMRNKFESLPPEKQEELRKKREEIREELRGLSPEDRQKRMEEMRQEFSQKHEEARKERMKKMDERWDEAPPEKKEMFCEHVNKKCAEDGGFACDAAKSRCGE